VGDVDVMQEVLGRDATEVWVSFRGTEAVDLSTDSEEVVADLRLVEWGAWLFPSIVRGVIGTPLIVVGTEVGV